MAGSVGQYSIGWFPWVAVKSTVGTWIRGANSSVLGLGYFYNTSAAQNDERIVDLYLDSVVWKFAMVAYKDNTRGISTIQLDGVSQGTLDWYNAADIGSQYAEITNLTVTTPSVKSYKMIAATKNAASSGYAIAASSDAWIRTGGTPSTPGGTDTPGYTWEWIPWMASKSNTTFDTRAQSSVQFGGGYLTNSGGAQNSEVVTDFWEDTGTFTYGQVYGGGTDAGICHIRIDDVDKGTIDGYNAGNNAYGTVVGVTNGTAGVKKFAVKMATKNASSTSFYGQLNSAKWTRTGA